MSISTLVDLRCIRCGAAPRDENPAAGCFSCRSEGSPAAFATVYDLDAARETFRPQTLDTRPFGPSRYGELMPAGAGSFALAEGATPLLEAERLAARLGVRSLLVKDESRNPTWSFKDRAAAVAATRAIEVGSAGLVVSSTGNAAAATSAYAAAAGLPAVALFAVDVDPVMNGFVRPYGAAIAATPTKSDRWVLMRRCVEEFGFYPNSNFADPPVGNDPYAVDGYKAIAFELWDQMGHRTPTAVATPVGYGDSLFAMNKAFEELRELGLSDMPVLIAGEMYGSLSRAVASGGERPVKVERPASTVATSIATAQSTYQALHALRKSDGTVFQVSDQEVLEAQRLLVETEGLFVEAASAAGLAALLRAREETGLDPEGDYVFVNTSSGIKSINATGAMKVEPRLIHGDDEFSSFVSDVLAGGGEEQP
jgi:threonine synthase